MRWKRGNRLKLVNVTQASGRTCEIFDEIRHSLGVPVVPILYQAYAAFPEFLERHWEAMRPALGSRQFFLLGARLAAESYTRAHNYFEVPGFLRQSFSEPGVGLPMSQVLDYFQYLDPLLLLIAAAQMQAFEGILGQAEQAPEAAQHPSFPVAPRLLNDAEAKAAAHRIWDERRRLLDVAFISDEHRALACWPDFYDEYWIAMRQFLRSPLYEDCQYRIGESAWNLARELPVGGDTGIPSLLEAGLGGEEVSSLARINEVFVQAMSGLLLDITFARIGCEGGTRRQQAQPEKSSATGSGPENVQSSTRVA